MVEGSLGGHLSEEKTASKSDKKINILYSKIRGDNF
jgi:hypothetical protein